MIPTGLNVLAIWPTLASMSTEATDRTSAAEPASGLTMLGESRTGAAIAVAHGDQAPYSSVAASPLAELISCFLLLVAARDAARSETIETIAA